MNTWQTEATETAAARLIERKKEAVAKIIYHFHRDIERSEAQVEINKKELADYLKLDFEKAATEAFNRNSGNCFSD